MTLLWPGLIHIHGAGAARGGGGEAGAGRRR